MTDEITVRPATAGDAEAISRLVSELSREYITPDYTPAGAATLLSHQTAEAVRKAIEEGDMTYFVAQTDGAVVGAVGILPERRHLYHLFVARTHHRRGIGRRLWDAARTELEPGPVTVNSSRFAIPFYEGLGFLTTGPQWEKDGVIAYPMRWESIH